MAEEVFIPQLGQTVEEVTIVSWYVKDGDTVKQGQEILEVETDKAVFDVEATADGTIRVGPFKAGDVVPVLTVVATIGSADDAFAAPADTVQEKAPAPSAEPHTYEELFIPQLGQTVEEVKLVSWRVQDGEKVRQGQEVLEVETDKAVFDVEATADGTIHFGPFQIGDMVPVLTVVAIIGDPGASFATSAPKEETPKGSETEIPQALTAPRTVKETAPVKGEKLFASPRARRLADAKGVDLTRVTPSGGNGIRITEADVMAYLKTAGAAASVLPGAEISAVVPLKGVRGVIAERMAASSQTTARVTLFMEVDATSFSTLREKLKDQKEQAWGFKAGYNDLLVKVCAGALKQLPYMNARINSGQIEQLARINIGVAVDAERGLYVPVIKDADRKTLREIGSEFRQRVEDIRSSKILPEALSGGTFTITNLGMYDVDGFTPVINLPEAAILGVGRILDKAVVVEGEVTVRKMMVLSLAFDHRLVDGAPAARFLQVIKEMIESPDEKALIA
jgi:pyruvate dehydrogenase E2 component (dihydrolipoamide acetyltransferase)